MSMGPLKWWSSFGEASLRGGVWLTTILSRQVLTAYVGLLPFPSVALIPPGSYQYVPQ